MTRPHIAVLESITSRIAQPNVANVNKKVGHKVAHIKFKTVDEAGDTKDEYTFVDPENKNVALWESVIQSFIEYKPCKVVVEFTNGVEYLNKQGLIDADVNDTAVKVVDVVDPDTHQSKLPKHDPKRELFRFG